MRTAAIRQHFAALSCSLSIASTGVAFVWYAPLMFYIVSPEAPVQMTTSESSWLVSSIELGCMFCVLPGGIICDIVGRKYPVMFCGPVTALTFVLNAYIHWLPGLFIIRQIQGLCLALAYTSGPIYIAEVSEPALRGGTSCHIQTLWYIGGLFAYCVGPYVSYKAYALVSTALPLLLTVTFFFMPDSPYYLLMKGRKEEAKRALSWLRGGEPINEEFKMIEDTVQREFFDKGSWKDLFLTKKDRKGFLIVQLCCLIRYLGGMSAIVNYLSQTLGESSTLYLDHHQLTIAAGILLTSAAFCAGLVSDRVGRRPMLIYSGILCGLFSFLIGGYYFLDIKTDFEATPYVWVLYISLVGFIVASNFGLGPLMQTIQAEYFSARTRGIGGGLTLVVGSAVTFVSIKSYQYVQDEVGVYLNYWLYSIIWFIGSVCIYFVVPETAGLSLGQIQIDLKK